MDPSKYLAKTELISCLLNEVEKRQVVLILEPVSPELKKIKNAVRWLAHGYCKVISIPIDKEKNQLIPEIAIEQALFLAHEVTHIDDWRELIITSLRCGRCFNCLYFEKRAWFGAIKLVLKYRGILSWQQIVYFYKRAGILTQGCKTEPKCLKRKEIRELDKSFSQFLAKLEKEKIIRKPWVRLPYAWKRKFSKLFRKVILKKPPH